MNADCNVFCIFLPPDDCCIAQAQARKIGKAKNLSRFARKAFNMEEPKRTKAIALAFVFPASETWLQRSCASHLQPVGFPLEAGCLSSVSGANKRNYKPKNAEKWFA